MCITVYKQCKVQYSIMHVVLNHGLIFWTVSTGCLWKWTEVMQKIIILILNHLWPLFRVELLYFYRFSYSHNWFRWRWKYSTHYTVPKTFLVYLCILTYTILSTCHKGAKSSHESLCWVTRLNLIETAKLCSHIFILHVCLYNVVFPPGCHAKI